MKNKYFILNTIKYSILSLVIALSFFAQTGLAALLKEEPLKLAYTTAEFADSAKTKGAASPVYQNRSNTTAPKNNQIEYNARQESVSSLLKNVSALFGMSAITSKKIKGDYTGVLAFSNLGNALGKLSNQFDLTWYKTGKAIYFYKNDELQSTTIKTQSLSPEALRQTLKTLGAYDPKFTIRGAAYDGINLINVSAPPIYHQKIQEVINSFAEAKGSTASESIIKVFKLKYNSAYDRNYEVNGQPKVIPGIATILNNIFAQGFDSGTTYLTGSDASSTVKDAEKQSNTQKSTSVRSVNAKHSAYADIKTNSVIVNTYKSAIPMVAQLIETLDVPERQIEIELNIVDVNSNKVNELGVDWAGYYNSGNLSLNFNKSSTDTLINTNKINASIRALSTQGQADIVARPSVIVKNNIEAVLENTETFYVKLTGVETVDLVPVNYGTKVVVQPRIMQSPGSDELVYITVNVSDGSSSNDSDSDSLDLPTVRNMYISTQASVQEGQSLLLGGYSKDRLEKNVRKIPGISKIPILKHLFSSSTDASSHQVRLFIITPRIQGQMLTKDDNISELPKDIDQKIERLKHLNNDNPNIGELSNVNLLVGCGTPKELRTMRNEILKKGNESFIRKFKDKNCLYLRK